MLAYLRLEILRTLRRPAFLGWSIGFPAVFYLLFTTVFNHGDAASRSEGASLGMASMALYGTMIVALPGIGARIAVERAGWTRHLALSPMRPGAYLLIKLVAASVLTVPAIAAILVLGRAVNGVHLSVGHWLGLLGLLWLGSLPFVALGLAIGYGLRDEIANGAAMIALFTLSILGGLWLPASQFPGWLRGVAGYTPGYRAGQLAWSLLGHDHVTATGLAVLLAWAAAFAALAAWRYRRV